MVDMSEYPFRVRVITKTGKVLMEVFFLKTNREEAETFVATLAGTVFVGMPNAYRVDLDLDDMRNTANLLSYHLEH